MRIQAVLLAGDRGAAKAIGGKSKAFVEISGKPMIVHVLETLLDTPEVSEVFVVGNHRALERMVTEHGIVDLAVSRSRAIHIVPQRASLFENVWHAFLETLPEGEAPEDHPILVVPADIPLVIPEEISQFLHEATRRGGDYVVGLSPDVAMAPFAPRDGEPGIEMACFNIAEGRFRQNNLHFVRPLRMGNRHYIQDMYENRYQKEIGSMLRLGWRIVVREFRNLWVLFYYLALHVASVLDRRGYSALAARLRSHVPLETVERGVGALLQTRFQLAMTGYGGAAMDVDNAEDLEAADKMLPRWRDMQRRMSRQLGAGSAP